MQPKDFQPRYKPGRFRDCPWCGGRGCAACDAEAEKAYQREFPDGPQVIATVPNDATGVDALKALLVQTLGQENITVGTASFVASSQDVLDNPHFAALLQAARELGIEVKTMEEIQPDATGLDAIRQDWT